LIVFLDKFNRGTGVIAVKTVLLDDHFPVLSLHIAFVEDSHKLKPAR
jgi:hypothetical protein